MVFHFFLEIVEEYVLLLREDVLLGKTASSTGILLTLLHLQFFPQYRVFLFFFFLAGACRWYHLLAFLHMKLILFFLLSIGEGDSAFFLLLFPIIFHSPSVFPSVLFIAGLFLGANGSSLWFLLSNRLQRCAQFLYSANKTAFFWI